LFSQDNYQLLEDWIYNYEGETIINWDQRLMRNYTLPAFNIILKIDSVIKNSPADDRLNSNRLRLHIIDHYINEDNLDKVVEHYRQLNLNRIAENFREGRLGNKHSFFYKIYRLAEYFAWKGRREDVIILAQSLTNNANSIRLYSLASLKLLQPQILGDKEDAFVYLDSAISEFDRIQDFLFTASDPRIAMVLTPALIGGKDMTEIAQGLVQDIRLFNQSGMIQNLILGNALRGDYYTAYSSIPDIALTDRLFFFSHILAIEANSISTDPEWSSYFYAFQNYRIWEVTSVELDIF
jgi:hypothetical protein